jgi:hypothetical protein
MMKAGKGADGSGGRGNKKNPSAKLPEGLDTRKESARARGFHSSRSSGSGSRWSGFAWASMNPSIGSRSHHAIGRDCRRISGDLQREDEDPEFHPLFMQKARERHTPRGQFCGEESGVNKKDTSPAEVSFVAPDGESGTWCNLRPRFGGVISCEITPLHEPHPRPPAGRRGDVLMMPAARRHPPAVIFITARRRPLAPDAAAFRLRGICAHHIPPGNCSAGRADRKAGGLSHDSLKPAIRTAEREPRDRSATEAESPVQHSLGGVFSMGNPGSGGRRGILAGGHRQRASSRKLSRPPGNPSKPKRRGPQSPDSRVPQPARRAAWFPFQYRTAEPGLDRRGGAKPGIDRADGP